ncbi:DUF2946 family protein [Piscinibacter gummiphilus]|uniref:DUF2946 family protein n=1 Tax=Piscinibacter gummiphilus TaxID=946333 RepID=A0ABZ0CLW7_9BURK|nr:DUF2946 family protein [Piscinibacter gummiphilus]WOB05973.1 DUF2946 family protein [Piscinibacter gummiphilus]
MKQLRLWLIVLLVALLPVRGGMAAAMLCGPMGTSGHAEQRVDAPEHHGHHHAGAEAAHAHHGEAAGAGEAHHDGAGHDNKCTMCSAFCSATPLPSAVPQLPEPATVGATQFADLDAPAPTFQSGGPERPPRSI